MSEVNTTPSLPTNAAQEGGGNLAALVQFSLDTQTQLLKAILTELRVQTAVLVTGLNVRENLIDLRADSDNL